MKLAWCTDTHLDFCSKEEQLQFCHALNESDSEVIGITGDISTGNEIIETLKFLLENQSKPIWFVLGNHDYYHSSITQVREQVRDISRKHKRLVWLENSKPILLSKQVALLGHSGWGDAKNGAFQETPIRLTDHRLIKELSNIDRLTLQKKLHLLGEEAAAHLSKGLNGLSKDCKTVWVLTHVPPFPEAAWHGDKSGHWDWIPDFTCQSVGNLLLEQAELYPEREFRVLCGHGHSAGEVWMRKNLYVRTGEAEYHKPKIVDLLDLNG
jgi:predicted phosphohydrolase